MYLPTFLIYYSIHSCPMSTCAEQIRRRANFDNTIGKGQTSIALHNSKIQQAVQIQKRRKQEGSWQCGKGMTGNEKLHYFAAAEMKHPSRLYGVIKIIGPLCPWRPAPNLIEHHLQKPRADTARKPDLIIGIPLTVFRTRKRNILHVKSPIILAVILRWQNSHPHPLPPSQEALFFAG